MGVNRKVFYSNSGAPLISVMIQEAPDAVSAVLAGLSADKDVKRACAQSPHVARRYQDLLDLTEQ